MKVTYNHCLNLIVNLNMDLKDVSIHSNSSFNIINSCIDDSNIYDSRTIYYPKTNCKIDIDIIEQQNNSKKKAELLFTDDEPLSINIYRYKFDENFTNELYKFSKIHQYDERKQFKESWNIWVEENQELVNSEMRRLLNLGYDGDVMDKMYKSARYYFRKKNPVKSEPKPRKNYISINKDLLNAMDKHISYNLKNEDFKPSEGFTDFCKEHIDLLKKTISILCQHGMTDSNEIKEKIKKTYKNRYFLVIN